MSLLDDHPRLPPTLRPGLRAVVRAHRGLSPVQATLPVVGLLSDIEAVMDTALRMHADAPARRVTAYLWNVGREILGILGHTMPAYYVARALVTSPAAPPPLPEASARVVRRWLGTSCDCAPCTLAAIAIATETLVWLAQTYLRSLLQEQHAQWTQDFAHASYHYVTQMRRTCRPDARPARATREASNARVRPTARPGPRRTRRARRASEAPGA